MPSIQDLELGNWVSKREVELRTCQIRSAIPRGLLWMLSIWKHSLRIEFLVYVSSDKPQIVAQSHIRKPSFLAKS